MVRIGISIWQGRISPVFDTAQQLLIIDIDNQKEVNRKEEMLKETLMPLRASVIANLNINVLICGAISRELADMLSSMGIRVLPFISGNMDTILMAYLENRLDSRQFLMPGCCCQRRRWRRGRRN